MAAATAGITDISALTGLKSLWAESHGDPSVCVAVLDGPVDQSHSCFDGANLTRLPTLISDAAGDGLMSGHGTHITSVIFGQQSSPVPGIAPGCRGLIIPVFSDASNRKLSQLDLARAINQAVERGANVINISGGELAQTAEADQMLANAVRFCAENNVLIVAAAGNDGCPCLHVPAALPSVLAVGAMNAQGLPFDFSNWGEAYQTQGILAPGENILGAVPGGGIALKSGTSFATPIVSGIVALLLAIQIKNGDQPNPYAVRDAILKSALPCNQQKVSDCRRFLVGSLNIPGAYTLITQGGRKQVSDEKLREAVIQPSEVSNISHAVTNQTNEMQTISSSEARNLTIEEFFQMPSVGVQAAQTTRSESTPKIMQISDNPMTIKPNNVATSSVTPSNVVASGNCGCNGGPKSLVYALGVIGYDFGTEARRDSFKQLMPMVNPNTGEIYHEGVPAGTVAVPANPYDARQMVEYLNRNISEASALIWTLNLELTPIYAIEPQGAFALAVYQCLRDFLGGQILDERDANYVERVSIPAVLTGKSVTLFSGQVVPVIEPVSVRGMYSWKVRALIDAVIGQAVVGEESNEGRQQLQEGVEYSLKNFLLRIYYDLRNLGQTSQERALNYAATNAFQFANKLSEVLRNPMPIRTGSSAQSAVMQLDSFNVERSPFCRMDSDCWDVKIKFFDPENEKRAKSIIRYTIDVSDIMPVTLGQPRVWQIPN